MLHYRGDSHELARLTTENKRFAESVAYADFSQVIVSAKVLRTAERREKVHLERIGRAKYKLQGAGRRPLVFSKKQPQSDLETTDSAPLITAETVEEAINQVFTTVRLPF